MRHFTVTVTTLSGTRTVTSVAAQDGFAAVNTTLDAYGEENVKRIAAVHCRAWAIPAPVNTSLPVVTVEGYKGPGL